MFDEVKKVVVVKSVIVDDKKICRRCWHGKASFVATLMITERSLEDFSFTEKPFPRMTSIIFSQFFDICFLNVCRKMGLGISIMCPNPMT